MLCCLCDQFCWQILLPACLPSQLQSHRSHLQYWTDRILILDHFLPFYMPLTTHRTKILKKWKNTWIYHHFTQVYHEWQSYDIWFLRYEVQQTECFVNLGRFLPIFPIKSLKNENIKKYIKSWRYHHFTQVFQKSWSWPIQFLRYGAWQM